MTTRPSIPVGVGLGLRWEFLDEVLQMPECERVGVAFFEVSPENYMRRGGYYPEALERIAERYAITTHGLSLNLGSSDVPARDYLRELKGEIERVRAPFHSDHLAFCGAGGLHLHEFFPLAWSAAVARRVADRLRAAEDVLGVPMAVENVSAYVLGGRAEMREAEFIRAVLEHSSARLLLDVNNVYVNSVNFGFDPVEFLRALPLHRVVEVHVAGHERRENMLVDTHGQSVAAPVLELLRSVIEQTGPLPVLLERDTNVPALAELLGEVERVNAVYAAAVRTWEARRVASA
jgi:uncharacterized protein (UPF0276 family)